MRNTTKKSNLDKKSKKGKGQKGTQRGALPNPFKGEFQSLPVEQQLAAYELARKRVRTQAAKLEKQGIADLVPAYVKLRDMGERLRTGAVGFASKFNLRMTKPTKKKPAQMTLSELKKGLLSEYKRVFTMLTSKTLYTTKKQLSSQLAKYGIDEELLESAKNIATVQKSLKSYWDLVKAIERSGLTQEFGLKSEETQDIALQFHTKYGAMGLDYDAMTQSIKKDLDELKAKPDPTVTLDETIYEHYFENVSENLAMLDNLTRELAQRLAKVNYGTKPVKESFKDGMGDFARYRRNRRR